MCTFYWRWFLFGGIKFGTQVIYMPFIDKKFYNLDGITMKVFFIIVFISAGLSLTAQNKAQNKQDPRNYMPTENVEMGRDSNKRSNRPKRKTYDYIYVPTADKVLYGNPCALEATHKMGFEYLVEPVGIKGSKTWKGKVLNNIWVKGKLVVLHTPFWKVILNSKFKKCRPKTGDIVG
jgi:hypothetical protein